MTNLDPAAADSLEALAACLRQLKLEADVSYRELEYRTKHDKGKLGGSARGDRVPLRRSTISDVLAGRKFPRKAFLLTFVEACGVDLDSDSRWEQAWMRLAGQHQGPADPVEVEQLRRQVADLRRQLTAGLPVSQVILPAADEDALQTAPAPKRDLDIRGGIAAAMDRRRAQREPVERLQVAWFAMAHSVEGLVSALGDVGARFGTLRQPAAEQSAVAREIEAELGGTEIRGLLDAIAVLAPDLAAIRNRINRDTVNIGLIGRVKAGRSTLLRAITDLGEDAIPSTTLNPTTAVRSRILHSPGRAEAEILLLTWGEFRDGYLAPLHTNAGCEGPVPRTPDEFAGYRYDDLQKLPRADNSAEGPLGRQKFLGRLHTAQDSFPSYRELLTGPDRKLTIGRLAGLRPYVAYPLDPADQHRPYHAVRDIRIYCAFPEVGVENLMLVDLPGAGEAGLDIDRQFLQDLRNEVDVLLQVKRPGLNDSYFGDADWEVLDLADEARMGVDTRDFVSVVINTDPAHLDPAYVSNAIEQTRKITEPIGLRLLVADVASAPQVREEILGPVLAGLAERLAIMDHAAATTALDRVLDVTRRATDLADRLARQAVRWQAPVSSEDQMLRVRASELRLEVLRAMHNLRRTYGQRAEDRQVIEQLAEGITSAKQKLIAWSEAGFGYGDLDRWLAMTESSMAVDPGETRDEAFALVRLKIRSEFSRVGDSVAGAVDQFQREVAGLLREHLGPTLVPVGTQPLNDLLQRIRQQKLETLRSALEELVQFRIDGNIYARISRPIVQQIYPERIPGFSVGGASDFHRALTEVFRQALDQIEERMRAESGGLAEMLAEMTDQLFDQFSQTPWHEFARLCEPVRNQLWPDVFDAQVGELAAAFDRVTSAAATTGEASRQIRVIAAYLDVLGNEGSPPPLGL